MIYILTHDDTDGFVSAAIALKYFFRFETMEQIQKSVNIQYVQYGQKFPEDLLNPKNVEDILLILDFSYPFDIHQQLEANWKDAFYIHSDHHDLDPGFNELTRSSIYKDGSNCGHMWLDIVGEEINEAPLLVRLGHDYDSWTHEHKESIYLNHVLINNKRGRDVELMFSLINSDEKTSEIVKEGFLFINDARVRAEKMFSNVENLTIIPVGADKCILFNSSENIHRSLFADIAMSTTGINNFIFYTIYSDGILFNMRSKEESTQDTGEYCKRYGGGGRARTGAFKLGLKEGMEFLQEHLVTNKE